MLLRLLLRKEILVLAGVTAAFAVPMFRSGELTVGKILHWVTNGVAPPAAAPSSPAEQGFGLWNPQSARGLDPPELIPQAPPSRSSLGQFLHSIFETQVVDAPNPAPFLTAAEASPPTGAGGLPAGSPLIPQRIQPATSSPAAGQVASRAATPPWGSGIPVADLREVIRFDVSPYWVQQRWQPTSRLALDPEGYTGYRVALVTDHRVGQLHGALTYYFDSEATVQRIQFQGTATDVAPLERLLTDHFRFVVVPDRERLLAPIHQNSARGMFRYSEPLPAAVRPDPQLREVAFEINSTQGKYQLSELYRALAIQ